VSTLFLVAKKNTQSSFLEAAAREGERQRESEAAAAAALLY
jgi:hypothetical protein